MPAFDKALLPQQSRPQDITTLFAAGSLTITKLITYKVAGEIIFEFDMSDSSVCYLKVKQGPRLKVGGASGQFDTGTEVTW